MIIMKNIELETETVQISIYCDIVLRILKSHEELSVNKILVFAYLIKKQKFIPIGIYKASNSKDVVFKCISMLAGDYKEYCNNIQFIIKALHLLISGEAVILANNQLKYKTDIVKGNIIYSESNFIQKAIDESKKMTDRQFLKEVMYNV